MQFILINYTSEYYIIQNGIEFHNDRNDNNNIIIIIN